jgi:hypothetical protein
MQIIFSSGRDLKQINSKTQRKCFTYYQATPCGSLFNNYQFVDKRKMLSLMGGAFTTD